MNNIFNSTVEISMRVLIILSSIDEGFDIDTLTTIDFMSTYSKDFKINNYNLHGNNNYNFSGFASRRLQIKKAINALLNANYIKAYDSTNGIEYKINEDQKKVCNNLKSTYSLKYKKIVKLVLAKIKSKSREQIINELNLFITNSVIKERGETL